MSKYSDETKAAVYGLRQSDGDKYFYVGCTRYDPQDRLKAHLDQVRHGTHSNKHFSNKVKKIGEENVICDVLEVTSVGYHFHAEKAWIDNLKSQGHKLVNRIHNEFEYDTLDYVRPATKEEYQQSIAFANMPMPVINCRIPELQEVLQETVRQYHTTMRVILNRLSDLGYEPN